MEDTFDKINEKTYINTAEANIFGGKSYLSEKEKSHRGSLVLYYINECNDKKKNSKNYMRT